MDVIIIGAGAAGLAAADALVRARRSVLVLEARDRIGGRCWSRVEPELAAPIEYGAEFIHGRPAVTLAMLRRFAIAAPQRAGTRWFVQHGELQASDRMQIFDEIRRAMRSTGSPRADLSFADYLERRLAMHLSTAARSQALRTVEGYDAADPRLASARAIVQEWCGQGTSSDVNSRPAGGYSAMLGALAAEIAAGGGQLHLQSEVRAVRWRRGHVEVEGRRHGRVFQERAACAIVTLPLGVLQRASIGAGGVRFTPVLVQKRAALAGLVSGPVCKVVLRFRRAFWESLAHGRYRGAGFFQAPEAAFPTFWTALPMTAPVLVAWAGGPRAWRMRACTASELVRRALASAQSLFGPGVDIEAEFAGAYVHDWQRDPFARGAYSYVKVGGGGARKQLSKPLRETLYFAGEATDETGEAATVAGALASGRRVAREVLTTAARWPRDGIIG